MSGRGRAGRTRRALDSTRLSKLAERPGIDPRSWLAQAIVDDVAFDPAHGMFADVTFIMTQEQQTCFVGAMYEGNGFGLWAPLEKDDVVLVATPDGDPNQGGIIVARLWNSSDKPPPDLAGGNAGEQNVEDATLDFILRVKAGKNLKLRTSGGGSVTIIAEKGDVTVQSGEGAVLVNAAQGDVTINASGKVMLGKDVSADTPLDGLVHGSGIDPLTGMTYTALTNTCARVRGSKT